MGLLSWLGRIAAGEKPDTIEFDEGEKDFGTLDMRSAIDAHMAWKGRLQAFVAGTSGEKLDVATVSRDNECTLGLWIHGEAARKYRDLGEYATLRDVHAQFHACAGGIVRDARAGAAEVAARGIKQDLRKHSEAVQLALVRLYAKARDYVPPSGVLGG